MTPDWRSLGGFPDIAHECRRLLAKSGYGKRHQQNRKKSTRKGSHDRPPFLGKGGLPGGDPL